ncbi:copper resistance D family protein [Paenibacillus sp. NPDC093718]|uniref:copper resistance D family protein n=1 Tax=Paenibacillus sp. NPDC093718 TaxID=3390601 RepID=UPI003D0619DA
MSYYWLSEPFLYVAYAILAGITVLSLVPKAYKPDISVPAWLGPVAAGAIIVFGFVPLLQIMMFFKDDIGFWKSFNSIMFKFSEGERYAWILVLSILLAILTMIVRRKPGSVVRWLMPVALLGIAVAMSSFNHAASLFESTGQLAFFGHFTAMAIWTGTLLITGWFSTDQSRWSAFLRWFHPTAIICVIIVIGSGLFLMTAVTPEPINSWTLSYGQALLVKHILILPLLVFAFVNGHLVKRKLRRDSGYHPVAWARSEGVLIWLIYIVTGYMNQQPAPHEVIDTLALYGPAASFVWFHPGFTIGELAFTWSWIGILSLCLGLALLWNVVNIFRRNRAAAGALLCGLGAVVFVYCGLMFSVTTV